MKSLLKKSLSCFVFLFVFSSFYVFCQDWFVCLGSFSIRDNAEKRVEELGEKNISSFIYETEVAGQDLYRVLFDRAFDDRDAARSARNKIAKSSAIKSLGISGLWICVGEKSVPIAKRRVPAIKRKVPATALQENKSATIPLSQEKPYSVLVRSYKEKYAAENARDRLLEDEIDAYVLGMYDDTSLFKFDLHAGAFSDKDETKDLIAKLEEKGIDGLETSDYNEISDSVEKYDQMVKSRPVVFDSVEGPIPNTIPFEVKNCIKEFPLNKNFQIDRVVILDFDNINDQNFFSKQLKFFADFNTATSSVHAASFSLYRDELLGKEVKVFIAQGDMGQFAPSDYEKETDIVCDYKISGGILKSKLYENENGIYLFGSSDDGLLRIEMIADNFTMEEFKGFMETSYSDSDMLVYPQLRKSLRILPENFTRQRDFQAFTFGRIQKDYVVDKNYADWAWGIYGHWDASVFLRQSEETVSVSFFDLDYDYNSQKIHGMFMDEHQTIPQNDANHREDTHDCAGWFVDNNSGRELSFANRSYIVSVNSYYPSDIDLLDLHDLADDLRIW